MAIGNFMDKNGDGKIDQEDVLYSSQEINGNIMTFR